MVSIRRIIETCIYVADLDRSERFYGDVIGLRVVQKNEGRDLFFAAGTSMLMVFYAPETRKGGFLPPHGTEGSSHFAFEIDPGDLDAWKRHLLDSAVSIEREVTWPHSQHRSIYIRDPDGNLVEFIARGVWPV